MGNEFVKCCHQTLSIDDDDDDDEDEEHRDTQLTDTAKTLYAIHKSKEKNNDHDQHNLASKLPENTSNSASKPTQKTEHKRKGKRSESKKHKNKNKTSKQKRSFSAETTSNHSEILLKQSQNEIEILRKQNEILKKQNEEFLLKYGSFFTSLPILDKTTSSSSLNTANSQNSYHTDLSQISQISDYDEAVISPLSPLITNGQSNIILSYANTASHGPSSNIAVLKTGNIYGSGDIYDLCAYIGSCKAVQRIINALKWYSLCGGDQDVLLNKLKESSYDKYLLNDYQHILNRHELIQDNKINHMNGEYKLIKTHINQQIQACDVRKCNGYKRYKRLTPKSNDLMDTMDLIHCVFIHSEYNKLLKVYI